MMKQEMPSKNQLKVPKIELQTTQEPAEVLQITKSEFDQRLSDFVRKQYLDFTKKTIKDNYEKWLETEMGAASGLKISREDIEKCAEEIELEAVRACMVLSIYRKEILNSIELIRKETKEQHLNNNLIQIRLNRPKKKLVDAATQTSDRNFSSRKRKPEVCSISLEEKMRHFEAKFCDKNQNLPKVQPISPILSPPTCSIPPTPTPFLTPLTPASTNSQITENIDEKILQELQELFGEEQPAQPEEEIFEEKYDKILQIPAAVVEPLAAPSPEIEQMEQQQQQRDPDEIEREMKEKLKQSIWPCELHHQRTKLRSVMSDIAERNYRHFEKVKQKFDELFDDNDDELSCYSPSIELDEILIRSCSHRISKWVVKALMRPLKDGLIENRCLFKKLARRLAEGIILMDQYPSERFVKDYIEDYFCHKRVIQTIEDIV